MLKKLLHPIRGFCTSIQSPKPWLFVGLGNPGDEFIGTRRNVGFDMIDTFAESQGIAMDTVFCRAIFGKGIVDGVPVLLAKPQTSLNLSGESSGPLAAYFKLPLDRVVVLHDDMDLPCGVLQLQTRGGGHGSHIGMKNVIHHFRGVRVFPRLRIGVGNRPRGMDPKAFVLRKFDATSQERINVCLKEGVLALKEVLAKGLEESWRFNKDQIYKHIKDADTGSD